MTQKIKKAVETFNTTNGNRQYSNKDLLKYIIQRIDNLPCDAHMEIIESTKTTIKEWKWFAGILITVDFTLMAGIFWVVLSKL